MSKQPFLSDVATLRKRARQHIEEGAVTAGYGGDTQTAIRVLNEALATEIICVLRYRRHYFMARGIHAGPVAAEFLEHATEEQAHADLIAERIVQLGGEPNFSPDGLATRSHSEYVEGKDLIDMIKEDLDRRTDRDRQLSRDRGLFRAVRRNVAAADGGDPGEGGGARRRPRRPADPFAASVRN